MHLHIYRRSQLETCASIAAARSPSQPWKANMFTVTSPFSLVLWMSKKSLSFHIFFVQSRHHNYFHSFIQDKYFSIHLTFLIKTFLYPRTLLLGWFSSQKHTHLRMFRKLTFQNTPSATHSTPSLRQRTLLSLHQFRPRRRKMGFLLLFRSRLRLSHKMLTLFSLVFFNLN